MKQLVIASGNRGKLLELQAMLGETGITLQPQADFDTPECDETGLTFVENAILKARNAASHSGLPALADDSGIEVDALDGAPGVRSARYAEPNASDQNNVRKLLDQLRSMGDEKRGARFQSVVVVLRHPADPTPLIAQGTWEGRIAREPRGGNGFGYDPIFWLPPLGLTAAELTSSEKNRLSHRALALAKLKQALIPFIQAGH